jgi:hypothetical protein
LGRTAMTSKKGLPSRGLGVNMPSWFCRWWPTAGTDEVLWVIDHIWWFTF